jgi:benzoyl-CoA reductase/2-hydroxyglutaryl-CoA dehydratase subunit BcrC/BadD/HgdB
LDGTDSGERTLPAPFDRRGLRDDPLMELAGAYFGSIPHAFRRPNSELFRWLKRAVAERGVRGIILRRYVWCDIWHAEVQRVREWSGLAVLDIDVNSDESAEGRTANRIEAFLEILR